MRGGGGGGWLQCGDLLPVQHVVKVELVILDGLVRVLHQCLEQLDPRETLEVRDGCSERLLDRLHVL